MTGYSPVFSAAFIQYTSETPNYQFEVPAGFTAVVRFASCTQNIGGYAWNLNIQDSEAAPALIFAQYEGIGIGTTQTWEGRVVCPEGGIIGTVLSSLGSSPNVYVGGYLLRNVAS